MFLDALLCEERAARQVELDASALGAVYPAREAAASDEVGVPRRAPARDAKARRIAVTSRDLFLDNDG